MLPAQSVCLSVPLVPPRDYAEPWAVRQRDAMRQRRQWKLNAKLPA